MATTISNPPGATYCDWCSKALAWKDVQYAEHEALCPKCWPSWLEIIADRDAE